MSGLRRGVALFTIVPAGHFDELTRREAVAALRWLPLIGAGVGALAGLPAAAVARWASHGVLLGAVLSVLALVVLTRALHLDGLADTVDGLGSRAPAERALEIMRRSDIGPFGVLAIVLVVLIDVSALVSLDGGTWTPVAALAVAAATGRVAALLAAHRSVPAARADGFGGYVAGSQPTAALIVAAAAVLGLGAGLAAAVDASVAAWVAAQAAALVVAIGMVAQVRRRIGGVTGDAFGALIEITSAMTLVGLALS